MNFTKNHRVLLMGSLLAMLGVSCSTESRIKHYSGDGEIKASPDYGFWGGGGGYTLKFEPIKLDRQTRVTYHFARLPHWKAELCFAIEDSRLWQHRQEYERDRQKSPSAETNNPATACRDDLIGACGMALKDADGKVILQFNKKLSELTWSRAGQGPWELYDQNAVNFTPDSREYVLEVTVDPDPLLKDDKCYVLIRGGGHEPVSIGF